MGIEVNESTLDCRADTNINAPNMGASFYDLVLRTLSTLFNKSCGLNGLAR